MRQEAVLRGKIDAEVKLAGRIAISTGEVLVPEYKGETEITPRIEEERTLATRDTILRADITVHKVPQFEVTNAAGGYTLIVGEELYNG